MGCESSNGSCCVMQKVEGLACKGLHTFKGMIGYCMKNNGNKHFEFVHHNVSADDMNGKMEHAKFRKVGLNDRVSLSHSNVLQRPINGLISV